MATTIPSGEKTCPMCAETIKEAAIVCKHCGYNHQTDEEQRPVTPPGAETATQPSRSDDIYDNPPTRTEIDGWSRHGWTTKRALQWKNEVRDAEINRQLRPYNTALYIRWGVGGALLLGALIYTLSGAGGS